MNARTPRSRVRARALRAALCGTSALVLLAGVALPVGFSPSSVEPFQKAAHAKGGGGGGGGGGVAARRTIVTPAATEMVVAAACPARATVMARTTITTAITTGRTSLAS